jgi:hypothetical protein
LILYEFGQRDLDREKRLVADQARTWELRRLAESLVLLVNTVFIAIPTILTGEEFYVRWWNVHLINRIAAVLLVPVGLVASFFIALFVQAAADDRVMRISFALFGVFIVSIEAIMLYTQGISWSTVADATLAFLGIAFLLTALLGPPART